MPRSLKVGPITHCPRKQVSGTRSKSAISDRNPRVFCCSSSFFVVVSQHCLDQKLQEEAERDQLETREKELGKEKDTLSTELLKLQAKKSGVTDPTEELQRELGVATEVNLNYHDTHAISSHVTGR